MGIDFLLAPPNCEPSGIACRDGCQRQHHQARHDGSIFSEWLEKCIDTRLVAGSHATDHPKYCDGQYDERRDDNQQMRQQLQQRDLVKTER